MKKIFLLLISVFCFLTSHTQITVKHFNADWNESNTVTWLGKLTDCTTKYYDITKYPALQKKYRVVVVPTIIVFHEGEEVKRFPADISFAMKATKEEVQEKIDEILMDSF